MTKISVNKIPYDGPKTHNQILQQIRTDLADPNPRISVERIAIIVSSFFGREVLFKDVAKKLKIWSHVLGAIYPGRVPDKKHRIYVTKITKYNAAKKYLEYREKQVAHARKNSMITKYNKWAAEREKQNLPYVTIEMYMFYRHLSFPDVREVTDKYILESLWRFNDDGVLIAPKNSRMMRYHFLVESAKKKAEKAS